MPYIALNEHDQEVTSFQCLDEFRREGIVYNEFRCAFCEVEYISKCIYKDSAVGKSPHFAVSSGKLHRGGCDGAVQPVDPVDNGGKQLRTVVKRTHEVPEMLVPKPVARRVVAGSPRIPTLLPTTEEIQRRRKGAGVKYGMARFTSSLLSSFVEAKAYLVREAFKEAREKRLTGLHEKKFLKEFTESYPLQLFEQKLNYNSAFWRANIPRKGKSERIFHASCGQVAMSAQGFTITSVVLKRQEAMSAAPDGDCSEEQGKKPAPVTAIVSFDFAGLDLAALPRAHKRLLEQLTMAASGGTEVNWHAYGTMTLCDGVNRVELPSLDHLHIKT